MTKIEQTIERVLPGTDPALVLALLSVCEGSKKLRPEDAALLGVAIGVAVFMQSATRAREARRVAEWSATLATGKSISEVSSIVDDLAALITGAGQ